MRVERKFLVTAMHVIYILITGEREAKSGELTIDSFWIAEHGGKV